MGKMLDMPECEEADMYPEFPRGHHARNCDSNRRQSQARAPTAFYDERGIAGAGKVLR